MQKSSPKASSEARDGKGLIKKFTGTLLTIAMLAGFTITAVACNNNSPTQNNNNNPNPPIDNPGDPSNPNENPSDTTKIGIDTIFEENFSDTTFSAAIHDALFNLADRAIPNSDTEITGTSYSNGEITLSVDYVDDGVGKSGRIIFDAPEIYDQLQTESVKNLVFEEAGLDATAEVEESQANGVINQIQDAINSIEDEIATSFAAIAVSDMDIELQKDPEPVITTTFDNIINEELGDYLGNEGMFEESVKSMIKSYDFRFVVSDIKVAVDANKLICYFNDDYTGRTSFKSISPKNYTATDFEDYINATLDSGALLDKYFTYSEQNNNSIVVGSVDEQHIRDVCENVVENINAQKTLMESINNRTDFTGTGYCTNRSELSDEETKQFALKLGYSENEIVDVYVTNPPLGGGFDTNNWFNTGYTTGFQINVLTNNNGVYELNSCYVNVPVYADSTIEDYFRYFLEGDLGVRYIVRDEETTELAQIIKDYSSANDAARIYMASVGNYDVYLQA